MLALSVAPLTKAGFAPFGEVVETEDVKPKLINEGFARRYDDLAKIDVASADGEVNISLFIGAVRPAPIVIRMMERHPLGSQLFVPLNEVPWLVVVCADPGIPSSYRAFAASGRQGVNYARNCWHHPLLVTADASPFAVVDRKGAGSNLEEKWLEEANWLRIAFESAAATHRTRRSRVSRPVNARRKHLQEAKKCYLEPITSQPAGIQLRPSF